LTDTFSYWVYKVKTKNQSIVPLVTEISKKNITSQSQPIDLHQIPSFLTSFAHFPISTLDPYYINQRATGRFDHDRWCLIPHKRPLTYPSQHNFQWFVLVQNDIGRKYCHIPLGFDLAFNSLEGGWQLKGGELLLGECHVEKVFVQLVWMDLEKGDLVLLNAGDASFS